MKIDESHQSANLIEKAKESGSGQRTEAQDTYIKDSERSESSRGAEVDLSSAGRDVMRARDAMEASSDPKRAEKVAELKQQVAEGTYETDPQKVADQILGEALSELI